MGEFRFRVPFEWDLDPYHANSIHVVGIDGVPWPCRIAVSDDESDPTTRKLLSVSRHRDESGKLYALYPFQDRGEFLICTGTLPVSDDKYELLTELARGTLNRLRNQISIWQEGGLAIADSVHKKVQISTGWLSESILSEDSERCDNVARNSIEMSMNAIFELSDLFGDQICRYRRENEEMSNFWLGNASGKAEQFAPSVTHPSFDLIQTRLVPGAEAFSDDSGDFDPASIRRRIIVGPWLDASVGGMSERLINLDDFLSRKDQLLIECRQQLDSIPDNASLIHVVSGLNGIGYRHLSYPQQLQVTVDMLRLIDETRIELPTMVSFDFPWAERLAGAVGGNHPLQIADSLLRQGLQISFLGLDINLDYWPNGSAVRDPLQWIDLVDVWAQLGLPLVINLRVPSGTGDSISPQGESRRTNQTRSNLTDQNRLDFLETVLPMLVARPSVHGMIWRQWQDGDDCRYPQAGLVGVDGAEKEIGQLLSNLRYLMSEPNQ